MKPSVEQLQAVCGEADEAAVRRHLERLDEEYFRRFDVEQVGRHLGALQELSSRRRVVTLTDAADPNQVAVTVASLDYPSVFSLICGVLAGLGFTIDSGDVFTYRRGGGEGGEGSPARSRSLRRRRRAGRDPLQRRRIIDHFVGRLDADVDPQAFTRRLDEQLASVINVLDENPGDARHRVNEMVTQRLGQLSVDAYSVLYPVQVHAANTDPHMTMLTISAQDTPAFLYALTNALALLGMNIERVRISTTEGMVRDEIGFVDSQGQPVTDQSVLDRVRLVVLLTKQFTYHLDKSPDPYTALSRFEQMVEDLLRREEGQSLLEMLEDPATMRNLGRLLGASDFLWEDFIRMQYQALLPILRPGVEQHGIARDPDTVRARLAQELAHVSTPSQRRKALNRFKDQEVFLLDLDQILRPEVHFRTFSESLTEVAEAVVSAAAKLAWDNLTEQYGTPRTQDGDEAAWAVFGLGKLGGAALGYASDIELMFIYEGNGQTDGRQSIATGEFFNLLAREVNRSIEAKQEGIFRVDLRVRPYGKNAPLAASMETFERYYAKGGDAHSWERMALVRMRAVAGDAAFGQRVEQRRDELIYDPSAIDLEELWQMRRMQWQQKRRPDGAFNAKYAPGALVDVEYAVQILQVLHGGDHPPLRTPRVHQALEVLADQGVIDADDAKKLNDSYGFMRQLINGLRMLRGSALDLFVPAADTLDLLYLARRMGYEGDDAAERLAGDIQRHSQATREFVQRTFGDAALPDNRPAET